MIPPRLRHQYWVGLSITQENLPFYLALGFAPMFAFLAGGLGLGVGLAEASLSIHNRSPTPAAPPAPSQSQT